MAADINKLIKCFQLAKKVVHYYWMHAPHEDHRVRVENVQRVVELMTGKTIAKKLVPTGGQIIRGMMLRYDASVLILVRTDQPVEWQKYTTIKELCHVVYDAQADFEPNPLKTLDQLVLKRGLDLDETLSPAIASERLAEIMALEILYPLEYREADSKALKNGKDIAELVELRHVPAVHIETATSETYIRGCKDIWEALPPVMPTELE